MENFIERKIKKLNEITLMETLNDVTFRRIFSKFIQKTHETEVRFESSILMTQYLICQKNIVR